MRLEIIADPLMTKEDYEKLSHENLVKIVWTNATLAREILESKRAFEEIILGRDPGDEA